MEPTSTSSDPAVEQALNVDIDSWLAQAKPPRRSVTVYGRGDLYARIQDLRVQADRLDAAEIPGDTRPGKPGDDLRAQADALAEQIESSRLVLHIRGALLEERLELVEKHENDSSDSPGAGLAYTIELMSRCIVQPGMTADQVRKLRRSIGEAQWHQVVDALENATQEPISVPLSRAGSAPRSTPGS